MSLLASQAGLLPTAIAREIATCAPRPDEIRTESRDGLPINGITRDGRAFYFHSRYATAREARRLAESVGAAAQPAGCVVVIGFGMGHHLRSIAERVERVIAVEPDSALLQSALGCVDLTGLLESRRLIVATGRTTDELTDLVASAYVPALHGRLTVCNLAGRFSAEPERMQAVRDRVDAAVEALKDDLAVQARFGRQWSRNALLNLPAVTPRELPDFGGEDVCVAAAGPSLADEVQRLIRDRRRIIAVDTALPALLASGIRPDLAITIDSQIHSYHHYLCAGLPDLPVATDLSVHPAVVRQLGGIIPTVSDHPLHTLLVHLGAQLPYVDLRAGNVTQAAVDLAVRCGARSIELVGADYSYPDGLAYARGTYLHTLFAAGAGRLCPVATSFYRFAANRPGAARDPERPLLVRDPLLERYAVAIRRLAASRGVPLRRVRGRGIALAFDADSALAPRKARSARRCSVPPGKPRLPGRLVTEAERLLCAVSERSLNRLVDRESGERSIAARALLPLLTCLRAELPQASATELLGLAQAEVRAWCAAAGRCYAA